MFVNKDKAQQRLCSGKNVALDLATEVTKEAKGLKNDNNNGHKIGMSQTPEPMRSVIGSIALIDKSCRNTGEMFGVGKTQVNEFSRTNEEVHKKVDDLLKPVRDLALGRLTKAMASISDKELEAYSGKTNSEIARNLSSVLRNVIPQNKNEDANKYIFNVNTPNVRKIGVYNDKEVIEVVVQD